MYDNLIAELRANAEALAQAVEDLASTSETFHSDHDFLGSSDKFGKVDFSLADLLAAGRAFAALINGVEVPKELYVPRTSLQQLNEHAKALQKAFGQALQQYTAVASAGGVQQINKETATVVATGGSQVPFEPAMNGVAAALDPAYAAWYSLRAVIRAPRIAEFGRLARFVEQKRSYLDQVEAYAKTTTERVEKIDQRSEAELARATEVGTEIARLLQAAQADKKSIDEHSGLAAAKVAEIKSVDERAATLATSVSGYQAKFDSFDEMLGGRTKQFEKQTEQLQGVNDRLVEKENEAKRLIDLSEGLLRGATNAGLASSFSQIRDRIGREVTGARWSFYVSICILLISSLPIALYVFPGLQSVLKIAFGLPVDAFMPKAIGEHPAPEVVAQIAARALLLIPGVWLVKFTAARHERLFRLREHYAYKLSIASSVEGFKQQAPELQEGIAATAFYELTFNPATRMDINSTEARHPNPAMEWLMKKLDGPSTEVRKA